MKYTLFIMFLCIYPFISFSQECRTEKRIYLVDVTGSMIGQGKGGTENIFSDVKSSLATALSEIKCDDAEVVIVPFTNKTFQPIRGMGIDRLELAKKAQKLSVRPGDTNIVEAWKKGVEEIDDTKINFLFLMTDGIHNEGEPLDSLYSNLLLWKKNTNHEDYKMAYYVMLTSNAYSDTIEAIAKISARLEVIKPRRMDVNYSLVSFNSRYGPVNIYDSKHLYTIPGNCECGMPQKFNVRMQFDYNPYYEIIESSVDFRTDTIFFEVKPLKNQMELPKSFAAKVRISYDEKEYPLLRVEPNEFTLKLENRGVRKVSIR